VRTPRKIYTPVGEGATLRRPLIDRVPVSDLCDEHQFSPTLLYPWQKPFFENGPAAFESKSTVPEGHLQPTIAALRDKFQRKNEVVAELIEEHIKLKKSLGSSDRGLGFPRHPRLHRRGAWDRRHPGYVAGAEYVRASRPGLFSRKLAPADLKKDAGGVSSRPPAPSTATRPSASTWSTAS
jgi:hypothetical protein